MRLIDADALIEAMKKTESEYENAMTCPSWWSAFNVISEQPTAYDINKVVEELEELKMRYFLTIANTGDEKSDFAYENVGNALDKAIEIVKQEAEQCNNGWIACSERLPEESGYYLVTYHDWSDGNFLPKYDDTYVRRLHYQINEHFVGWNYPKNVDDRAENDCHKEVIAWQPLPEPFKECD